MHVKLSNQGSDRATAYNISNKIVRRDNELYVGWLDAPQKQGDPATIQIGVCNGQTGALSHTIPLGEGRDNHCGPALLLDHNNRLHVLIGAHHGDFLHRWSDTPSDPHSWSNPVPIGPKHSYPAFCIDKEGTLHLAWRESGDKWQLQYTRKRPNGNWEKPIAIAQSPTPGYNHFMHSLSFGPTGTLHLTFQFHYSESGHARECLGKSAIHMTSLDGGDSWVNEGKPCNLPLTIETATPFAQCYDNPSHSLRIGTHVIDKNGHPWIFCSMPDSQSGVMWRKTYQDWHRIDLAEALPNIDLSQGKSTAISYDQNDHVHLLVGTRPDKQPSGWYDPSHELFHIAFSPNGEVIGCDQLTDTDPNNARWLPAIEQWNWANPNPIPDKHWYLYTSGVNAGLFSDPTYDYTQATEVYLGKLS